MQILFRHVGFLALIKELLLILVFGEPTVPKPGVYISRIHSLSLLFIIFLHRSQVLSHLLLVVVQQAKLEIVDLSCLVEIDLVKK